MARGISSAEGQATVELALCLPLVALVLSLAFEAGAVAIDKARLWHAAREAARVAAVDPDPRAIEAAADGAGLEHVGIDVKPAPGGRRAGEPVTVTAEYRPSSPLPIVGSLVSGLRLKAAVSMRIEQP